MINRTDHEYKHTIMQMDEDSDAYPSKKRKRLTNQISSGILSAPDSNKRDVSILAGKLYFKCSSKDNIRDHNIIFSIENNTFKFECDCNEYLDGVKTSNCVHLNVCIIELCKNSQDHLRD